MAVKALLISLLCTLSPYKNFGADDDTLLRKNSFAIAALAHRAGWLAYSRERFPVYGLGLQYRRLFSKKWSVETGLYQTSKIVTDENTGKISYRYLMLPLNIRFDRPNFYFSAGAYSDFLFLVNAGQSAYSPLAPHRSPNLGYNLDVGYKRQITEHWRAFIELRHFRAVYESNLHVIFRSTGLGIGIGRDF
jgi:hypothetical protein